MNIIDADQWLDGGTILVWSRDGGKITRYKFDYSLPWDGRPRRISVTRWGIPWPVRIGSKKEREICTSIRRCLEEKFGDEAVYRALRYSQRRREAFDNWCARQDSILIDPHDWDDPYPDPFGGFWSLVFAFVEKAYHEGKIDLDK